MWGRLTGKGKADKDKSKDKKKKEAKIDTVNDEDEDLLNFDDESNTIANISAYVSEINIEDNVVDEEIDFTDLDENDVDLNAAFDSLDGPDGDVALLESQLNDDQFSAEDMALFAAFEKEQDMNPPDPTAVAALQEKVSSMEKQILDLKRQALVEKKSNDIPRAMELIKQAKLLEKELEEPKEELEMLTEIMERQKGTDKEADIGALIDPCDLDVGSKSSRTATSKTKRLSASLKSAVSKDKSKSDATTKSAQTKEKSSGAAPKSAPPSKVSSVPAPSPRESSMSSVVSDLTDFTTPLPPVTSVNDQSFSHLESAVNEALKAYLAEAKQLKDSDKQKAAKKFTQYKALKNELGVILSRKALPYTVVPPLFHWMSQEKKYFHQDLTLGDTDLKLEIQSVHDIDSLLSEHGSYRYLSMTYQCEFLNNDKKPLDVVPTARKDGYIKYKDAHKSALIDFETIIKIRRMTSSVSQFKRRKVVISLSLARGMFHSAVALGQVKLPLEELLDKCRTGGDIPITDPAGKRGIGGFIRLFASLRSPISSPNGEVRVSTERELVIGPWPEIVVPEATASVTPSVAASKQPSKVVDFSCLSEEEKSDPLNVKWLESNDVLTAEKEFLEAEMVRAASALKGLRAGKKSAEVEEQMEDLEMEGEELQNDVFLVDNKLMLLAHKVQNGMLSMGDYLAMVEARLENDKKLAVFCSQAGDKASAVRVMKRIRIMQAEVSGAREMMEKSA